MSLWGNLDASNNAPLFWAAGGFTANVSANASVAANASNAQIAGIFGNTTIGFWREGAVSGIFGIDAIEANSQFSTGDGRNVTHAGWVHRVVGTGPVLTITANAGATGVNSFINFSGGSSGAAAGMREGEDEMDQMEELKKELQEVNLLNAKLLYTNKIFNAKNLNESQKLRVLKAFDKATSVKEAKVIFETLNEGMVSKTIKSSMVNEIKGRASKATGFISESKNPIVEVDPMVTRWQKLAGIK